jgi:hypothetical protein
MQFIGIVKRVIPFFLTFAAGLFIASFFVSLSAPSFEGMRKNRSERWGKHNKLKSEVEQLRREKRELQIQIEEMSRTNCDFGSVPMSSDFDTDAPPPPSPRLKELKMKTVTVK